jgi:hypothetical protein
LHHSLQPSLNYQVSRLRLSVGVSGREGCQVGARNVDSHVKGRNASLFITRVGFGAGGGNVAAATACFSAAAVAIYTMGQSRSL